MAVIAIDGHRDFGRCCVDQFFGRQFRWIPFGFVPIAAEQPSALGSFRGALANAPGKFLRASGVVEFYIVELRPAIHEMHVCVVKARQQALPGCIDHAGVGPAPGIHLLLRSDGNDAFADDGNRLSLGERRIDGPHVRVLDDEVRGLASVCAHTHSAQARTMTSCRDHLPHFFSRSNSGLLETRSGMICGHLTR